jgi:hypothetical protein
VTGTGGVLRLAAVDDNPNPVNLSSLDVWTFATRPGSPGGMSPVGGDAEGVDQLSLAIQEEVLRAALFGQADGTLGTKKAPSDPGLA